MLSSVPMCNMRQEVDLLSWHKVGPVPIKLENGLNSMRNLLNTNEKYCTWEGEIKCLHVKWEITSPATELQERILGGTTVSQRLECESTVW